MVAASVSNFRQQWRGIHTLWTADQSNDLANAVREDLEAEFGATVRSEPARSVRCAVGWREPEIEPNFLRVARARRQEQPQPQPQPRSECPPNPTQTRVPDRPKIAVLKPDPIEINRIAESIKRQLSERHNIQTRLVGANLVWNKWTVLEFTVTNGDCGSLHVILNGSGPGRAAWMMGVASAEQAVTKAMVERPW